MLTPSRNEIGGAPPGVPLAKKGQDLRRRGGGEGHGLSLPRADATLRERIEAREIRLAAEADLPLLRGRAGEVKLLAGRLIEGELVLLTDRQAVDRLIDRARIVGIAIGLDEIAAVRAGRREWAVDRQILAGIVGGSREIDESEVGAAAPTGHLAVEIGLVGGRRALERAVGHQIGDGKRCRRSRCSHRNKRGRRAEQERTYSHDNHPQKIPLIFN
ncbi:hypothetical protein [Sphingomonas sp. MMS24-J13]|uniref:hypothetical protein n=1 Tax=Sphingomonas sp. MMS24-J13 TaxID=3238686 RepID=UPI00384C4EFC